MRFIGMKKLIGAGLVVWISLAAAAPGVGLAQNITLSSVSAVRGRAVPELDPSGAGQALALLFGGVVMLRARARRRTGE
jgi:hypothetical protein